MRNFHNTRTLISYLSTHISGNAVDFGAGNAKYRDIIRPHTVSYTTFDMIPGEHIDIVGDALNPPFADNTFDTVLSTQMLEHVEKPWLVVSHIKRILKPGGICIATAPFLVPYHADPHDFFRYTKQGLESLFKNEGFTLLESGRYGNTASVLAEMLHFSHFSHYKNYSGQRKRLGNKLIHFVKKIAFILDRWFWNDAMYANTYIVVQKRKE